MAALSTTDYVSDALSSTTDRDVESFDVSDKVRQIRRQLALGLYDLETRLDVALNRMLSDEVAAD